MLGLDAFAAGEGIARHQRCFENLSFRGGLQRGKKLEIKAKMRNSSLMTVVADSEKRVLLPVAQPGDSFDLRIAADGTVMLFRLTSSPQSPADVKVELRNGFSVGVLDHPIDEEALKQALADFP